MSLYWKRKTEYSQLLWPFCPREEIKLHKQTFRLHCSCCFLAPQGWFAEIASLWLVLSSNTHCRQMSVEWQHFCTCFAIVRHYQAQDSVWWKIVFILTWCAVISIVCCEGFLHALCWGLSRWSAVLSFFCTSNAAESGYRDVTLLLTSFTVNNQEATPWYCSHNCDCVCGQAKSETENCLETQCPVIVLIAEEGLLFSIWNISA